MQDHQRNTATWPFIVPTTTHINNNIPAMPQTVVGARTFIDVPPEYEYVVQPEDTLASVARKLFGVNSRAHRAFLSRQGFSTGERIVYNGKLDGNISDYTNL